MNRFLLPGSVRRRVARRVRPRPMTRAGDPCLCQSGRSSGGRNPLIREETSHARQLSLRRAVPPRVRRGGAVDDRGGDGRGRGPGAEGEGEGQACRRARGAGRPRPVPGAGHRGPQSDHAAGRAEGPRFHPHDPQPRDHGADRDRPSRGGLEDLRPARGGGRHQGRAQRLSRGAHLARTGTGCDRGTPVRRDQAQGHRRIRPLWARVPRGPLPGDPAPRRRLRGPDPGRLGPRSTGDKLRHEGPDRRL